MFIESFQPPRDRQMWDILSYNLKRRFQTLREVVMLHTMMAAADFNAWLKAFLRVSNFRMPSWMRLEAGKQLALKYTITIPSDVELEIHTEAIIKHVFGVRKYTEGFYVDYPKIHAVTVSKGVNVVEVKPIPVKLRFAPTGGGYRPQIAAVQDIQH